MCSAWSILRDFSNILDTKCCAVRPPAGHRPRLLPRADATRVKTARQVTNGLSCVARYLLFALGKEWRRPRLSLSSSFYDQTECVRGRGVDWRGAPGRGKARRGEALAALAEALARRGQQPALPSFAECCHESPAKPRHALCGAVCLNVALNCCCRERVDVRPPRQGVVLVARRQGGRGPGGERAHPGAGPRRRPVGRRLCRPRRGPRRPSAAGTARPARSRIPTRALESKKLKL